MPFHPTRRGFLAGAGAFAAAGLLPAFARTALAAPAGTFELVAESRVIDVDGKAATVFGVAGPGGRQGVVLEPGERFSAILRNRLGTATIVHWHGQTPPPEQDGVASTGYVSPILDGESATYDFAPRPGTHWMHSHQGLQEQRLLAAPLIVRTPDDAAMDAQEVVVMLHDFSFRDPEEILAGLTGMAAGGGMQGHDMQSGGMQGMDMPGMDHGSMNSGSMNHGSMDQGSMDHAGMAGMEGMGGSGAAGHAMPGMDHGAADLNDIRYDAFLANDRTLSDPEIVRVERNGKVRLRVINGATASNFWLDLGALTGTLIAVDGNEVVPLEASRFPLAMAQRLDIVVTVKDGAFPILAQLEGATARTGIVLATPGAAVPKVPGEAEKPVPAVDLSLEGRLRALYPLGDAAADIRHDVELGGSMMPFRWTMDGRVWSNRKMLPVRGGKRIVIGFTNPSPMSHPMHLHGHHFQVVEIDGRAVAGAVRDTVLVMPGGSVRVAFDADNPGRWLIHCHNLYHMVTGMMTEVVYEDA
ncbi:Multicopper oxidase [Pseudoxanthobacter soli DSM 19599]|uniref:Multicopper oxidase n=1 Tax=Pseudoxanthobacter soli DSM 19599 TaxID=1123029 RepID=A0A1M7ZBU6_9HYPH|nr:multicopper oxidase domain-containing protein [Pseudoxanthobacter soli]SHO62357.1 Multicopper oxidase [Pseudoxanthobacter soli DSM 19599]